MKLFSTGILIGMFFSVSLWSLNTFGVSNAVLGYYTFAMWLALMIYTVKIEFNGVSLRLKASRAESKLINEGFRKASHLICGIGLSLGAAFVVYDLSGI